MDMPPFLRQTSYDHIITNILATVKEVFTSFATRAAREEIEKNTNENQNQNHLIVSEDGTWKKRGFTSLFGVTSLIGYFSGKVLDINIKSAFCEACQLWKNTKKGSQYEEWKTQHEPNCRANHQGSAGKMEMDAVIEMFKRSDDLHHVKYANYIGDGDSKTFSAIKKADIYDNLTVQKKGCIGHVQKRMGKRLRNLRSQEKGLGGMGKLTCKMIDKLTIYYGLAIRRNSDSAEKMRNDIWATFFHYSSTDKNPQHEKCSTGSKSRCEWQKALAALPKRKGKGPKKKAMPNFKHSYPALPQDVLNAIKPIYEDLSKEELLERCVGGFTQNNNESYNQLIWKISPKHLPGGVVPVEIAAYSSACIFNKGNKSISKIFDALGVPCGTNSHRFVETEDERRISISELRAWDVTKEARIARKQQQANVLEDEINALESYYGPGIDDDL